MSDTITGKRASSSVRSGGELPGYSNLLNEEVRSRWLVNIWMRFGTPGSLRTKYDGSLQQSTRSINGLAAGKVHSYVPFHLPARTLICVTGGWQIIMLRSRPPGFGRSCSSNGFGSLNDAESAVSSLNSPYLSGWRYSSCTVQPQLTKKELAIGENGEHSIAGCNPIICRSLLEP